MHGVQAVVRSQFPTGYKGYACDVGANDGEYESNTIQLENEGWTVLCVEPNPKLVQTGTSKRRLWRQVAAGSKEERRTFVSIGGYPYASASRIDAAEPGVVEKGDAIEVQVLPLDIILEQAGFPRLDFLTVDTEGWEEEVMRGFSPERWKTQVISLEHYGHAGFPDFKTGDPQNPMPIPGYGKLECYQFDVMYLRQEPWPE